MLERIAGNQLGAMVQILEGVQNVGPPHSFPDGAILNITDYVNGTPLDDFSSISGAGELLFNSTYGVLESAHSIVRIRNISPTPVLFSSLAMYESRVPGQRVKYGIAGSGENSNTVDAIYLLPGEEGSLSISYDEALGSIGDSISDALSHPGDPGYEPHPVEIDICLLATNETGTYFADRELNDFGNGSLGSISGGAMNRSTSTLLDSPPFRMISLPVRLSYWTEGDEYWVRLRANNPFPEPLTVRISFPISSEFEIIDLAGGNLDEETLEWRIGLQSKQWWEKIIRLKVKSHTPKNYPIRAKYSFEHGGDGTLYQFESNELLLTHDTNGSTISPVAWKEYR